MSPVEPSQSLFQREMSVFVQTEEGDYYQWWDERSVDLYRQVQEGEIYWSTILFSLDEEGTTQDDCEAWLTEFPNEQTPILADTTNQFSQWMEIMTRPAISVVNEEMMFDVYAPTGPYTTLNWLFPRE